MKPNKINNNIQYLGNGYRITTQHLELEGLSLIADSRMPVAILEGLAISVANNIADSLASQLGLLISKEGITPPKLTEIELNATDLTDRVEEKGLIELYRDSEGYRVWVDWSFGIGGLESNKILYIQKLTDFANDLVVNDAWEKLKDNAKVESQIITDLAVRVDKLAEQLTVHIPAYTKMGDSSESLVTSVKLLTQSVTELREAFNKPKPSLWDSIKKMIRG